MIEMKEILRLWLADVPRRRIVLTEQRRAATWRSVGAVSGATHVHLCATDYGRITPSRSAAISHWPSSPRRRLKMNIPLSGIDGSFPYP